MMKNFVEIQSKLPGFSKSNNFRTKPLISMMIGKKLDNYIKIKII